MIIDLCGRTRIKQRKAFDDGCIEGNAAAQWLLGCQLFSGIIAMRNKKDALRITHKKGKRIAVVPVLAWIYSSRQFNGRGPI